MARGLTASEVAAKWSKNTKANKDSMKRGVEQVTESPTAKAAQAVDRYAAGCAEAASSGRFAQACRAVSLEDWKQAFLDKGMKNLDNGVNAAESKQAQFYERFLPYIRQASDRIRKMDKGGIDNAMARVRANLEALQNFKNTRTR